jgi:hypothetical protein
MNLMMREAANGTTPDARPLSKSPVEQLAVPILYMRFRPGTFGPWI